jgi:hypothetical protein
MDSWTPRPALDGNLPSNWEERWYEIELPDRRGYIAWQPYVFLDGQPVEPRHGWRVVLETGEAQLLRDTWEEFFFEVLRYPPEFDVPLIGWRQAWDDEVVDLEALQPFIDGKPARPTDTPEIAGLR